MLEEERLIRVLFGRADSWLDWRDSTKDDRPLVSFLHILGIALQGIAIVPVALVEYLRKSSSGPKAKVKAKGKKTARKARAAARKSPARAKAKAKGGKSKGKASRAGKRRGRR